nr:MAG TPA: hypothetical protein [Inoviridae sp.]
MLGIINFYLAKLLIGKRVCIIIAPLPDIRFACYGVMSSRGAIIIRDDFVSPL